MTSARDALADFDRGMETYCLTFGQFSLMDAVEAILEKTGPADVAISTWTAGMPTVAVGRTSAQREHPVAAVRRGLLIRAAAAAAT